jgi:hypothetical protein
MAGFKGERGTESIQRARRVAKPEAAKPAIDMEIAINAGKAARDNIIISRAGALDITHFQQRIRQVEMRKGKAGFGLDCRTKGFNGRGLIAASAPRIAKVIEQRGIGRREAHGVFQSLPRRRDFAAAEKRKAEQTIGLGMLWLLLQKGAIPRNGRIQITGLMLAKRGLQIGRGQGDSFRAETALLSLPGKAPARPAGGAMLLF